MSYKPSPNIVWIDEEDEIRLYDAQSNQFQSLNETGTLIWRLAMAEHDHRQIVEQLIQTFQPQSELEAEQICQDVGEYLDELKTAGLLVEAV